MLREQLQQIPIRVKVNEDVELAQRVKVLVQHHADPVEPSADVVVVSARHLDELDAAGTQAADGGDDVRRAEGDVLDAGAAVVVDVLFDLGLFLAGGGLVDGHLDGFVGRGHDDGAEGGVFTEGFKSVRVLFWAKQVLWVRFIKIRNLRADVFVVNGPETVKTKDPFIAAKILARPEMRGYISVLAKKSTRKIQRKP